MLQQVELRPTPWPPGMPPPVPESASVDCTSIPETYVQATWSSAGGAHRGRDYMHARFYSPQMGRFFQVDPVLAIDRAQRSPQFWNRYAYAANNSLNLVDPTGELAFLPLALAAVAVAEAGLTIWDIVEWQKTLNDPNASNLRKVGEGGLVLAGAVGPGGGYRQVVDKGLDLTKSLRAERRARQAFHYTSRELTESIMTEGLRKGSYATRTGKLTPLQAQIDLALPPNRGLRDAVVRVDLAGLRKAGYEVPEFTRVGRSFNMPGGGYEIRFDYPVPPEFLQVVTP